jgi:hypothetical protein
METIFISRYMFADRRFASIFKREGSSRLHDSSVATRQLQDRFLRFFESSARSVITCTRQAAGGPAGDASAATREEARSAPDQTSRRIRGLRSRPRSHGNSRASQTGDREPPTAARASSVRSLSRALRASTAAETRGGLHGDRGPASVHIPR